VLRKNGSADIDEVEIEELKPYIDEYSSVIKLALLVNRWYLEKVLQVEIPKESGVILLGIPTVLDCTTNNPPDT